MPVWNTVKASAAATDKVTKEKTYQLYSDVASLYHSYRPRYSGEFLTQAIEISPLLSSKDAHILEIGCGPGTVTLQLLQRGFQVTAMDPGVGMIRQAKEVCKEFSMVKFQQTTFAEFQSEQQYDAIVAASSLHWALAEVNVGDLIQKLHALLKPQGTMILLWNFPFQPDESTRDAVADATGKAKPYYFSGDSTEMHVAKLGEKVLTPLEESKLFTLAITKYLDVEKELPIQDFFSYLKTLSMYITMSPEENQKFFSKAREVLERHSGPTIHTVLKSVMNILTRTDSKES